MSPSLDEELTCLASRALSSSLTLFCNTLQYRSCSLARSL
jgi:hypothetical protein